MTQTEPSDSECVRLSLENADHFALLVNRYELRLSRFLIRLFPSLNREDVRELVQDSFIQAYRNLNDFDPELAFANWIYRITRNQAVSALRKSSKFKFTTPRPGPDGEDAAAGNCCEELYSPLLIDEETAEAQLDRAQRSRAVMKWVESLPIKYREPFVLKFLEDKDYNEISDILQIPVGTVGTLIHRAKKEFKAAFQKGNRE